MVIDYIWKNWTIYDVLWAADMKAFRDYSEKKQIEKMKRHAR